jgi:Ca2+-transporting ATPase
MNNSKPDYLKTIEEVERECSTDRELGLGVEAAEERLEEYGENRLEDEGGISIWEVLVRQFKSIVMLLLTAAAIASFFIGEMVEGVAVLIVILITAILGLVMEYRAGKSIEALQKRVHEEAKVIRGGEIASIPTEELVPGDVVILEEGDQISADGRIVEDEELDIDESMLTGESESVKKSSDTPENEGEVHISDRNNMVFMGTSVLKGKGRFIVTSTGNEAEIGKISRMLQETEDEVTPLEERLEETGQYLIILTLAITGIVAVIGYLSGEPLDQMIRTSIALAIAAVPEGLPVAATITLAIGMNRMVRKKALMRNLPAVETLGSATVFCVDKTGTLTENEMTLQRIAIENRMIEISGTGYSPEGEFSEEGKCLDPLKDKGVSLILKAGLLCSDAVLNMKEDDWEVVGDPTEGALVVGARKAGLKKEEVEEEYPRTELIPFDSQRKFMAVLNKTPQNGKMVFLKGAPEVVLEICDYMYMDDNSEELTEERIKELKETNRKLAEDSFRILGLAYKEAADDDSLEDQIEEGMVFLGFVGMMDPPREDIGKSIAEARKAGIRTVMLTGDQHETAIGIARSIGIEVDEKDILKEDELKGMSVKELEENLRHNSVYARVTPRDKLNIVSALRNMGHIVAMTGDGVNDAPALNKSDIGVAMGIRGTTVAKEASDMILLDDRFSTIVEAVRQGRVIFDNIQKFIHYLLSCNLSEILFIFMSIIAGVPIPIVALQILWLNVVTGVFPALAMAWELPEAGVMENPPRNPKAPIITNRYKLLIGFQGLVIAAGPMLSYIMALNGGMEVDFARSIGFMTLAMVHLLQVFNVRRKNGLGYDRTIVRNPYMIGALVLTLALQLLAIYVPFLQRVLGTTALTPGMWVYVLLGASTPNVVLQMIAVVLKKRKE